MTFRKYISLRLDLSSNPGRIRPQTIRKKGDGCGDYLLARYILSRRLNTPSAYSTISSPLSLLSREIRSTKEMRTASTD